MREAIEFELERGGQVYYVYNRVETIEKMVGVPARAGARACASRSATASSTSASSTGACTPSPRGEYDLLLASTIIENGIDIPNVNTMIVHRADRFGLAQLYQLRGRVGREPRARLLLPAGAGTTACSREDARKRLEALREFTELGAGFRIAARDLEIRGAGNLLGAEQSGHIAELGIETYLQACSRRRCASCKRRGGRGGAVGGRSTCRCRWRFRASYIADENLRMEIYRKLAAGRGAARGAAGRARRPLRRAAGRGARRCSTSPTLKRQAEALRVQSISAQSGKLMVRLRRDARVDVERLIELVSLRPGSSFSPSGVLTLEAPGGGGQILQLARATLEELLA